MSTMDEIALTEFLLARIAEDLAELDRAGKWDGEPEWWMPDWLTRDRLRAELKAKRRIVERWVSMAERTDEHGHPAHLFDPVLSMLLKSHEHDLRDLASVYADHPDFREERRP